MGRLKAVAYDIDGTLMDSVDASLHVLQDALKVGVGLDVTLDELAMARHATDEQVYDMLGDLIAVLRK